MEWRDLTRVHERFRDWEIEPHPTGPAWVAVRRTGTAIRVIAGNDLADLRARLERISEEETARPE